MLLPNVILLWWYYLRWLVIPLEDGANIITSHLILISHPSNLFTFWLIISLILILPVNLLLFLLFRGNFRYCSLSTIHHRGWHLIIISLILSHRSIHRRSFIGIPIGSLNWELRWFLHCTALCSSLSIKHSLLLNKWISLTQLHL